jgi:galactokinase
MIHDERIIEIFEDAFNVRPAWIARAPGRVNLIGEHTDYNGGFVFPAAINREMKMAARLRDDKTIHLYSGNFDYKVVIDLSKELEPFETNTWANYFLAVAAQFQERGINLPGLNVALEGDVPLGAGLSSSAAYEVCAGELLSQITKAEMTHKNIALLSQAAEHSRFVGVKCGIMDQFISALGSKDKALKIDCFSLDYELIPFDSGKASIVIINSMKKRGLVDSEYNQRRKECEEGLKSMKTLAKEDYSTLRHIPMDVFESSQSFLSENVVKRVRHNLTENQRVLDFKSALSASDFKRAGELLYQSHASLRDDFQVSCKELDMIVEIASGINGCYGCRMTGAGFGGCAVALVQPEMVESFVSELAASYQEQTGKKPDIYVTPACAGAGCVEI